MVGALHKLFNRAASRLAIDLGWARRHFAARRGCFRVLTYHGLIPDELADRAWVPSHYVTVARFDRQMAMLAELGPSLPVGEVLERVQDGFEDPPAVCITFDDGMADNLALALPILRKHGHRATFFLATGSIGGQELLLNDILRLLRPLCRDRSGDLSDACRRALFEDGYAKSQSILKYAPEVLALWVERRGQVDTAALEQLRPMTWSQAREVEAAGMEIGAHTVNHVILTREKRRARRDEILHSVATIRSKLHSGRVPFAYPNGLEGDYDSFDQDILAAIDVPYAVTQQPGWNDGKTCRLALHRNCVGLHCTDYAFLAQVFGIEEHGGRSSPDDAEAERRALLCSSAAGRG